MSKILKSKWFWLILCQLLILFAAFRNIFPSGFIFAGGDVAQYFNLHRVTQGLGYTWSNLSGEGIFLQFFSYNLYYIPMYGLKALLHLSDSGQSFIYYGFFLSGSFWGFYYGSKFFLRQAPAAIWYRICFAIIYTFNFYVLYNFYYIWGFSPFLFLYTLIPPIFGLTYEYFETDRPAASLWIPLGVVFFLSNIANGNMAFFIALNAFLLLFVFLLYFLIRKRRSGLVDYVRRFAKYYLFYLACVAWSVLPQILELVHQATVFGSSGSIFDLKAWILWQSIKFPNVFFLVYNIRDYFGSKIIFGSILFFAMVCIIVAIIAFSKKKVSNLGLTFLVLIVGALFLENKGSGIFPAQLTLAIFNNSLLGALRSYDKILIFIPFFLITLLLVLLYQGKKTSPVLPGILVLLTLASSYVFFTGGIQTKYSSAFAYGLNYESAKTSFIHQIPNEYFDEASKLNDNLLDSKIFSMPFSVLNSPGWANYPKWKLAGVDPTTQLFDQPTVEMNSYGAFGTWSYGEDWNKETDSDSLWLMPMTGYLNARYIIYHKDVAAKFISKSYSKIKNFESSGYITKVSENAYFITYQINDKYYLPHFYVPLQNVLTTSIENTPSALGLTGLSPQSAFYSQDQNRGKSLSVIPANATNPPTVEYKKINPTKYRVIIHNATDAFPLVFSESYNDGWKIYPKKIQDQGKTLSAQLAEIDANYQEFGNNPGQAAKNELINYVNSGLISTVGAGTSRDFSKTVWSERKSSVKKQDFKLAFISRQIKGTIQNNNLTDGSLVETWLAKPMAANRYVVNGYANSWLVDPELACKQISGCVANGSGKYDFELVVEFQQQKIYYIGLFISLATLVAIFGHSAHKLLRSRMGL